MQPSTGFTLDVYLITLFAFVFFGFPTEDPRYDGRSCLGWSSRDMSWRYVTWRVVHGGYIRRDSFYIHRVTPG